MANVLTTTVNGFNTNHYEVLISNIPNLTEQTEDEFDLSVINNNIKGITIPDLSISYLISTNGVDVNYHAASIGSRDLGTVTLEIEVDDGLLNWYYFYWWAIGVRNGIIANNPPSSDKDGSEIDWSKHLLKDNCINALNIYSYDNINVPKSKLSFYRCQIETISSLTLKYGESDHATFTVTLKPEGMSLKLVNDIEDARE